LSLDSHLDCRAPHLLVSDAVDEQVGPWVLLEGFIGEGAGIDHRKTFTFLRGVLVKDRNIEPLQAALRSTEYPGNRSIPEPPDDHYLFSGEIGWSGKYGYQKSKRAVRPYIEEAFGGHITKKIMRRYGDLNPIERLRLMSSLLIIDVRGDVFLEDEVEYGPDDLIATNVYERIPGIRVEVPVRRFAWESYHSEENRSGTPYYASPAMVCSEGLRKSGPQVDLVDGRGRLATLYRDFHSDDSGSRGHLLYMRADILEKYLRQRRMSLVWINWGEREMDHNVTESLRDDDELQALWAKHAHIHEEFFVYDPLERRAIPR
jgi:hypothetical protein